MNKNKYHSQLSRGWAIVSSKPNKQENNGFIILIYNYMEEINIEEIFFEQSEKKFTKILGL